MSQNDFTIANQSFPAFRADLNSALQALASNNSGATEPSTTFANMWWYDSANNIMYIRNEDNDAWIKFAELDQANDKFVLSGTLQLDDGTVSAPALTFNSDTNMGIYRGGTDILKFVTAGTDAITIDASQNVTIGNNLSITGNGSTSDLTGSNIFRIMGDDVRITNSSGSEAMATSNADGAVTLYHDASPKLATTNTGIDVTGTAVTDGLTVAGNVSIDGGTIKLDGNYPIGTDNVALGNTALTTNVTGGSNVAVGANALALTTNNSNTAVGTNSLANTANAGNNTAVGQASGLSNTSGENGVFIGRQAGYSNTTGGSNVAVGRDALYSNTTASNNTAVGYQALLTSTTASENNAFGKGSLQNATTGGDNSAFGVHTLHANTEGSANVAMGHYALDANTTGSNNVGIGSGALGDNTTGERNICIGSIAGEEITTADDCIGIGYRSCGGGATSETTGHDNVCVGTDSGQTLTTGERNTCIGRDAGTSITNGSQNSCIGFEANVASSGANNSFTLGNSDITTLRCNDTSISSLSDQRDKTNIQDLPSEAGLALINALRPVTFNWDRREWYDDGTPDGSRVSTDFDNDVANSGLRQGFIAQEVATAISGIKALEDEKLVYDINPDKLELAPAKLITNLVKAVQELSAKNDALEARLSALENG